MSMNRKQTLTILAVVLFMAGLSWSTQYKSLQISQQAPDFNLPAVNGRNYKLADFLHLLNSLGYNHVLELDSNTKLHIKELVKKIPFDNTKNVMFIA